MGILRRLREWREDKDGTLIGPNIEADSVDAGSVNTGSLTDTDDGQAWETLREAGFETGGFIPLITSGIADKRAVIFNNTTYQNDNRFSDFFVKWDALPVGDSPALFGQMEINNVGSGETLSLRLRNVTDGETIAEKTGVSTQGPVTLGPVSYTPTSTTDGIRLRWQWKTDTGTNDSTISSAYISVGATL